MRTSFYIGLLAFIGWAAPYNFVRADQKIPVSPKVADAILPTIPTRVGGILGERLDLWRHIRLWRVAGDPFLLDGFLHPPGKHPWQGEHVGKWLHAASLAAAATDDPKLNETLRSIVKKLIAAQDANGYLGTYASKDRFYNKLDTGDPITWDVWTQRYAICGLLSYCASHNDAAALRASEEAADLLLKTFGAPSGDITRFGMRHGVSAVVLLESIVMLYQQTGDARYLDFAKHIVRTIERNPELRIMAAMRAGDDVNVPGDGKAYQLMAVLLGYVELYRATGDKEYLDTAVTAWEKIQAGHVNLPEVPGATRSRKTQTKNASRHRSISTRPTVSRPAARPPGFNSRCLFLI